MSIATQSAVLAIPLMGFGMLAIDASWMGASQAQLQAATDSAALAAVAHMGDEGAVQKTAASFAERNTAAGAPVAVDDVSIGTWVDGVWTADPSGTAVRVQTRASDRPTLLAGVMGFSTFDLSATAIAQVGGGTVCALIGESGLELNGNGEIDAYNSSVGSYLSTASATAGVCSNARKLQMEGNITVYGDVHPGPGGSVRVKGSATVTGTTTPLPEDLEMPVVKRPSGAMSLPEEVKKTRTLAPGTYYRKGSFKVNGKGKLVINGPTRIVIEGGDVSINGRGVVNTTTDPHNLTIEVLGDTSVHNNGSSVFYGSIIAPDSEVELNGNADLYGIVIGKFVHVNGNMDVHLDLSLADGEESGGGTYALVH